MRTKKEIEEIINLHNEGYSYNEIAKMQNTTKSIVAFYCNEKRSAETVKNAQEKESRNKEYEEIICKLVSESDNINQVCKKLNKRPTNNNYKKIQDVIEKYHLDITHFTLENSFTGQHPKYTDEEVFSNRGKFFNLAHLKKRLFDGGYREYKCECCGISEWQGKPISLQVHHINGDRCDNRLENLQVLCPNCHSQTESYCSKKEKSPLLVQLQEQRQEEKIRTCPNCEKKFYRRDNGLFCSQKCYIEYTFQQISKEELLQTLKDVKGNFTEAGRKYGITDNAFRKRCKKYGIPTHKQEILDMINNGQL